MSKAFIDTTILTNALLKPGDLGKSAKTALRRYDITELPVYAIKEFKAGPLKNFAWFHNKLVLTKSFYKGLQALQRMSLSPKRYTVATALEALQGAALSSRNLTSEALVEQHGEKAKLDTILCDRYRLAIRTRIEMAWQKRRKMTSAVVHPLPCYIEMAPAEENGLLVVNPTRCEVEKECCLGPILKQRLNDLQKLKLVIDEQPIKAENRRRARSLKDIYRTPKRPMTEEMCRSLGDAYFALFAPKESVILTTNIKDHEPLAICLGKKVEEP